MMYRHETQRGFVLIVALIVLMAMTMASIALVRSVDSATQIANNLGFKQSSLATGDLGTELAVIWLQNNTGSLTADAASSGYYATEQLGSDFTGRRTASDTSDDVDWTGATGARRACWVQSFTPTAVTCGADNSSKYVDAAGNSISFIVQRMCNQAGAYTPGGTIVCATSSNNVTTGSSKGGVSYGSYAITGKAMISYRVTTRVAGPRNTTSYVQSQVLVEY